MTITCVIRYEIDPFQREAFKRYAENWGRIIPRCGGHLVGYFLPHEGTNDVAWGLIAFESLAACEAYRARLKTDGEGRANFALAQDRKLILKKRALSWKWWTEPSVSRRGKENRTNDRRDLRSDAPCRPPAGLSGRGSRPQAPSRTGGGVTSLRGEVLQNLGNERDFRHLMKPNT